MLEITQDYSQAMLTVILWILVIFKKLSSYEAEKQFGIPRHMLLNKYKNVHNLLAVLQNYFSLKKIKNTADAVNLSADLGFPLPLLDLRIIGYNYLGEQ